MDQEQEQDLMGVVTQKTRFIIIQDIIGHPVQSPSMKELDYMNPSRSKSTLYQAVQELVEAGIVEERVLPDERRRRDRPYTFYGLTDAGREFLDEKGMLEAEETLGEIYERVQKTDEVKDCEVAPRP